MVKTLFSILGYERTILGTLRCLLFWACVGQLALWAFDRDEPFAVKAYSVNEVKAGGYLEILADVRRDLDRRCSVEFSRYLYDSRGIRTDLTNRPEIMSSQAIQRLHDIKPNQLGLRIPIPHGISPGPAKFQTQLTYQCDGNPVPWLLPFRIPNPFHAAWPIQVLMEIDFEVHP
jgi:hypothetical protein